jgi:hypothetical protein
MDLVGPVIGKSRGEKLIAALYDIEKVKDARALRKLYVA